MHKNARIILILASILMALAVAFGALGSHLLAARLPAARLAIWHTAVDYHVYHALGLLAIALVSQHLPASSQVRNSAYLMAAGVLAFSGSLYAYALSGAKWLTAFAPVGGLAFIAAWVMLAVAVLRSR